MSDLASRLAELEGRWKEKASTTPRAWRRAWRLPRSSERSKPTVYAVQPNSWTGLGGATALLAQPDGSPWVLIAPSSFQQFGLQESLAERMRLLREAEDAALNAGPVDDNDRELLDPTFWWEPTWLPVARAASPTVLAVDLAGESVSLPVRVVEWSHIDGFREIRARSLAEFVGVLLDVPDDCWAWMPEEQRWDFSGRRLPTEFSMSGFF